MRIISGKYKGRRINPPKNLPVRPTTDLSKEALFNILNHHVHFTQLSVLDLFAGTGNMSYEFSSRGAQDVLAVDAHYPCIQFIKKTASEFDMPIIAYKSDVFKYLDKSKQQFNFIFADPPYDFTPLQFEQIVNKIFEKEILSTGGMLVVEHSDRTDLSHLENFTAERKYGSTTFSFFELNNA